MYCKIGVYIFSDEQTWRVAESSSSCQCQQVSGSVAWTADWVAAAAGERL